MEGAYLYQGGIAMGEELNQIMQHVRDGHHFLLSGGAGSGKTYTLVQVIREIINEHPNSLIACITYTNAAVREIESRVNHDNLRVSTIHDFLWDCMSNFQNELRDCLVELINAESISAGSSTTLPVDASLFCQDGEILPIQYKEYLKVREGVISHDEVLIVTKYMFEHYKKLREVVKGIYPYILIDEYQDTSPLVVETLLRIFAEDDGRPYCVGFFGDSMQAIYDDGVGDIDAYKYPQGTVYEVKKEQNRRSPEVVINIANKIRLDDLQQRPSDDASAPNMVDGNVKKGEALFVYSQREDIMIDDVRRYLTGHAGWQFDDPSKVKELNLTHNLIAGKAGFPTLMDIHRGDGIWKYKEKVHRFVKKHAVSTDGKTFGEVLDFLEQTFTDAKSKKGFAPSVEMENFINAHPNLYQMVKGYAYDEFLKMYVSTDQLIDDKKQEEDEESKTGSKRSELVRHLMKIERCIYKYAHGEINEFLWATEWHIQTADDKKRLLKAINQLANVGTKTIGDIIELADEMGIVLKDEALERYEQRNPYIYERMMEAPYSEVQNLYKYLEGMTPFSTQHKTKGAEYDNVLVILDNGKWNNYNFERLFTAKDDELQDSVVRRTRKIFYVCCTRTKENLAVFYHQPTEEVVAKANEWFGTDAVRQID